MARAATQLLHNYPVEFDQNTGEYTISRDFEVTDATTILVEAGFDFSPRYIDIAHNGYDQDLTVRTQTVRCWLGTKRLGGDDPDVTRVAETISYHGRLKGILSVTPHVEMISEPLLMDLEAAVGDKTGIGTNLEGAPRELPMLVYEVTECIDVASFETRMDKVLELAGKVNESGWEPPWKGPGMAAAAVGDFLYLGVAQPMSDRRSRSVVLTHLFSKRLDWDKQHLYVWVKAKRDMVSGIVTLEGVAPAVSSKVYYVAGSSLQGGDDLYEPFSTLWDDLDTVRPLF